MSILFSFPFSRMGGGTGGGGGRYFNKSALAPVMFKYRTANIFDP